MLGRLAHPHIAELFDAGVSVNAQPYLVLEHVNGQNSDRYCDHNLLNVQKNFASLSMCSLRSPTQMRT
jgi:hypothetical protein